MCNGGYADFITVAAEDDLLRLRLVTTNSHAEPDQTNWFPRLFTAGSGDTGYRKGNLHWRMGEDTLNHCGGSFCADRAKLSERLFRNAEFFGFGKVGIGDPSPLKNIRATGNTGETARHQPSRTGLGGCNLKMITPQLPKYFFSYFQQLSIKHMISFSNRATMQAVVQVI